ncbi:hypothetical protein RCL_jg6085.t1 [Rhizophagus clarus]|uniref:Transmembrane protein n=1 Tax=Rhizophagus clarus TaxID=94130 RepID=A0A8H3L466_9GLOM|nr:hypothetical protein RCL_jg6085.t1 [Rhizophagus clarus]
MTSNFGIDTLMVLIFSIWMTSVHLWTRRFGLLLFKFGRVKFRWISICGLFFRSWQWRFQTFDDYISNKNGFNFIFGSLPYRLRTLRFGNGSERFLFLDEKFGD